MRIRLNQSGRRMAVASGVLAMAVTGATATTASAASAGTDDIGVNCFITENNVNYRSGPGTQYPSYGQVNKGQGFYMYGSSGQWYYGDMWGGRKGVWIYQDYCHTP
ncbi:SH3 domain-containing protein [Kribbella sp. WER1]